MSPSSRKPPRRPRRSRSSGSKKAAPAEALHPTAEPPDIDTFEHWDLGDSIQEAIRGMGIKSPTPIQALAIGPVLVGRHVIAKAETGTGKTLAFGAPMMARMDPQRSSVLALVLCPTRELTEQVFRVLEELGKASGLSVALIVGGEEMRPQVEALQAGAQVVVGTPGRVLDLMNQRFLSFPWTEFAVLDEADKMLEIGFIDDVRKILAAIPDERQTLLFSATFPPPLLALARESTSEPAEIATARGVSTVDTISQFFVSVDEERRPRALSRLINSSEPDDVFLVFCERRTDVDRLLRWMERERFPVKALHGGYDQASRFRVMSAFRDGDVKALLATDVASRGLDVHHVSHVVNYGVPRDISDYTHRIGRTGRAGRTGTAITLVTPKDRRNWSGLMRGATWDVEELDVAELGGRRRRGREDRPSQRSGRDEERSGRRGGSDRSEGRESRGGRDRQDSDGDRHRERRPRRRRDQEAERSHDSERGQGSRADGRRDETSRGRSEEGTQERSGRRSEERPERRSRSRSDRDSKRSSEKRSESREPRRERPEKRPDRRSDRRPDRRPEGEEANPRSPRSDSESRSHKPKPAGGGGAGGFGSGIFEPKPKAGGGRDKPRKKRTSSPPKTDRSESNKGKNQGQDGGSSGFGAGL